MIKEFLHKVVGGSDLTVDEASAAMDLIMDGKATDAQIAGLLIALKQKGETIEEVAGFVKSMRSHSMRININDKDAVDGCGTGGDGSHSFNISTAASIVAAGAGVTVAKHGNRSVSSRCGSADLLEKSGGKIDLSSDAAVRTINEIGFGFLFAPRYHPAMKYAAGPRKEMGVRTVFNILGPMTNPAGVSRQVIGAYDRKLIYLMAEALTLLGVKHLLAAHSRDGLDEFSISAPTDYIEIKAGEMSQGTLTPESLGLSRYDSNVLVGGDADDNLNILKGILRGKKTPYRDAVVVNAGAMIYVSGKSGSIKEGMELAIRAIDNSAAEQKLNDWVTLSNSAQ